MATSDINSKITDVIKTCWRCRHECQVNLYSHCLEKGEAYTQPPHVKILTDCIEICQSAADFMTRRSDYFEPVVAACADICDEAGKSCEKLDSTEMQELADICRHCAALCREISAGSMAGLQRPHTGREGVLRS